MPEKGETIGGQTFDGVAEAAVFPGELPADPDTIFEGDAVALPEADNDWRFVRFRPPLARDGEPAPGDSPRSGVAIPDRGSPRVNQRPPRPRAFRLDDSQRGHRRPASFASRPKRSFGPNTSRFPSPGGPIDEAELEVEAAQRSGLVARSRVTLAGLAWTGLWRPRLAGLGPMVTNLIEGLFAKAELLGIIGVVFGLVFLAGLIGLVVREISRPRARRASLRCTSPWPRPVRRTIASRRAGSSASSSRSIATARRPRYARAQVEQATGGHHRWAGPHRRRRARAAEAPRRKRKANRRRRQARVARNRNKPARDFRCHFRGRPDRAAGAADRRNYGGRPGLLGLIKLARSIGAHIAITGGMAVGDSLLQQFVGHGIASRISARMGEGVLNGMLTTRVGLSALAVAGPCPFRSTSPPASLTSHRSCSAKGRRRPGVEGKTLTASRHQFELLSVPTLAKTPVCTSNQ